MEGEGTAGRKEAERNIILAKQKGEYWVYILRIAELD